MPYGVKEGSREVGNNIVGMLLKCLGLFNTSTDLSSII